METRIRKLETFQERYDAERLIATAFLHPWEAEEAEAGARDPLGEAWGAFDGEGRMVSAVTALRHRLTYEGGVIPCGELHMVGTLPEARGSGAVTALMGTVLREYRAAGDLFATLIPFSFAFYRKYGFEAVSDTLEQKAEIGQFASFRQEMRACRIQTRAEADHARELHRRFALGYNLTDLGTDADWTCGPEGEMGRRDWQYGDRPRYSYLFRDGEGKPRAWFTFVFVHGPEGPFTGTMEVTDLVFDSPEALRSVFGFWYGMRAKITHVRAALPRDVDLAGILPESGAVERRLDGHWTARVLNPEKVLEALRPPEGAGCFSLRVNDRFLPENTGTWRVEFAGGKTMSVVRDAGPADLEVTAETFCRLAAGTDGLRAALYREGTRLSGNAALLERVFARRTVFLR